MLPQKSQHEVQRAQCKFVLMTGRTENLGGEFNTDIHHLDLDLTLYLGTLLVL